MGSDGGLRPGASSGPIRTDVRKVSLVASIDNTGRKGSCRREEPKCDRAARAKIRREASSRSDDPRQEDRSPRNADRPGIEALAFAPPPARPPARSRSVSGFRQSTTVADRQAPVTSRLRKPRASGESSSARLWGASRGVEGADPTRYGDQRSSRRLPIPSKSATAWLIFGSREPPPPQP